MKIILYAIAAVGLASIVLNIISKLTGITRTVPKSSIAYRYSRKDCIMTNAEHAFFNKLYAATGSDYYLFPQIHLSAILDHKVNGQEWRHAFKHINGKSVDYVLCDRESLRPVLAIELDDWSHAKEERIQRDTKVERILADADLPMLRVNDARTVTIEDLSAQIKDKIAQP